MAYKIIITRQPLCDAGMAALAGKADCAIIDKLHAYEFLTELQKVDGLMIKEGIIGREEMEACPNLKVIARHGVGYETVDVKAAAELGIPVVYTPGANARSVAEHTLALILALTKNLVESHNETLRGNWNIRRAFRSYEFEGRLVGMVGLGRIGGEVARLCQAVGFRVCAYDPFIPADRIREMGYSACESLEELLRVSDVVSVHVHYNESTRNMIAEKELTLMKPDAILINVSRGGIVNEADLARALETDRLGGAGLDVFVGEVLQPDSPLTKAPRIICTPHMAAQTNKAVEQICDMMVAGTLAILDGKKWPYVADRSVYEHPRWKDRPWADGKGENL